MTFGAVIRPFRTADQTVVRRLILDGLAEHFGVANETLNPDLTDIAKTYDDAVFLVAEIGTEIIGSGALVYEGDGIARVVRMSVRKDHRRRGIATAILERLLAAARASGYQQVVIETGFWRDSIGFYRSRGSREMSRDHYGPNMVLDL